ncbi:hypothetical protein BCR21_09620 [Enterococcus ureasiticus]|uniref:Uncharacterized protein n=1 Tax=Enterococcus ureasiticus TaxID=903984 RepID=A0A1E5GFR0_9ENTE|nr:hypothetical protein BCR21_09620 [Enterococcus ureasiticus]
MKNLFTTNKIWRIAGIYLIGITLVNYFRLEYNPFTDGFLIQPLFSVLVFIDLVILVLLLFKTKIGFILTYLYLVMISAITIPSLYTLKTMNALFQFNDEPILQIQVKFYLLILYMLVNLVIASCLLIVKSSRTEFKAAYFIKPSFLIK